MPKKKRERRKKLRYVSAETLAARASGYVINENRCGTLIRLLDTAIFDWFFERDPFTIHLLVCTCWMVLADLGKHGGKGPQLEKRFGRFSTTAVYDFLRHAEADKLNDSVDLVPMVNSVMLFDAITSFERIFNGRTAYMMAFQAHYAVRPAFPHPKLPQDAEIFLPEGVSVEKAERLTSLGRIAFFTEVSEMFAQEILRGQAAT